MAKKKKDKLTFERLREQNVNRCETYQHKIKTWSNSDWIMALTGELGEAANILKKVRRGSLTWDKKTKRKVEHELADVMCYLDLLAARLDIDLAKAVVEKFNIVSRRFRAHNKL